MTWQPLRRQRLPLLRGALAMMLLLFGAYVGLQTDCDDRIPGLVLLPAYALQLAVAVFSLGLAAVAGLRRDRSKAFAEMGVGLFMLLSIAVAETVFAWLALQGCE
jgi:hypothetical protein